MTLAMPDSTNPGNIPAGYPAVLGYCDGRWPTAPVQLPRLFPGARIVGLTVLAGQALGPDGVDVEPGNCNAVSAADWVRRKLDADPGSRPVVYADLESPGYGMPWCIAALLKLGITRDRYRILTAHYTGEAHICSPQTCEAGGQPIGFTADGTQWTDSYPGLNGSLIDMSLLDDNFFADWTFAPVRGLVGTHGPHSLRLTWSSPGQVAPEAVHHYQVTVRLKGGDIHGFPVTVPKTGVQESVQWNGVERGTYDQAMVRAVAVDGHASPWSVVGFR